MVIQDIPTPRALRSTWTLPTQVGPHQNIMVLQITPCFLIFYFF